MICVLRVRLPTGPVTFVQDPQYWTGNPRSEYEISALEAFDIVALFPRISVQTKKLIVFGGCLLGLCLCLQIPIPQYVAKGKA